MVKMNKEAYDKIQSYIKSLGFEGYTKYSQILEAFKKKNDYSDLDMEVYNAILKCESLNKIEEGFMRGYDCPKCRNRGYLNTYYIEGSTVYYPVAVECECMNVRRYIDNMKSSGITEAMALKYTFDNFVTDTSWRRAQFGSAYAFLDEHTKSNKNDNNWFIISGRSGSGKTHLCTALVSELALKKRKTPKYILWKKTVDSLLRLKRDVYSEKFEKQLNELETTDILYIDDFLKLLPDGYERTPVLELAYTILNARYNNGLITIISTELSAPEIADLDDAIYGRMTEKSKAKGYWVYTGDSQDKSKDYRLR
jgi:DNA replication protein DnaC